MLLLRYLRLELRHRLRQAMLIATGLAVGTGLVITIGSAAAGVRHAQAQVLRALYGVGTDITVGRPAGGGAPVPPIRQTARVQHLDFLSSGGHGVFPASAAARLARLPHVASATGWLALTDTTMTVPGTAPGARAPAPLPEQTTLDGVDPARAGSGPLAATTLLSGRALRASDADAPVALVDSTYASVAHLRVGSTLRVAGYRFTVVGVVRQPPGSAVQVLVPLRRAQHLAQLTGQLSDIAVTADSATNVTAVASEITAAFDWAQVSTAAGQAAVISGSLGSTAKLASELGSWLSATSVLAAAALAALLTLAAVSRRAREFGTLKALGWRTRRVVAQVLAEAGSTGLLGALFGVMLGFGGAALVSALAPRPAASVRVNPLAGTLGGVGGLDATPTVQIRPHASVTVGTVLLAALLGITAGLLAGLAGTWRAARLRPADAIGRLG
jgi:putative ABC transport system permease protein